MDWKPTVPILEDSTESEPTKPSKPGSVGFEGATSAESCEIGPEPDPVELARASAVLRRVGVRILRLEGVTTIGLWSDLDGPDVRKALRVFGSNRPTTHRQRVHGRRDEEGRIHRRILQIRQGRTHLPRQPVASDALPYSPPGSNPGGLFFVRAADFA